MVDMFVLDSKQDNWTVIRDLERKVMKEVVS